MNQIILSTVILAAITSATTAMAQSPQGQKPSTFFLEEVEPSTSKQASSPLQALTQQQELASNIKKLAIAPTPAVVPVALPIQKTAPVWTLAAGRTVGQELQAWGDKAGWKVIWSMPKDWSVPASTSFTGDFQIVAADVIKTLAANGALVRAQFFKGNKTMVVTGPGVAAQ